MKLLLTGASSFTGFWFAKALSGMGHEVTCAFTQPASSYSGIRKERVEALLEVVVPHFNARFGDEEFVKLLGEGRFDLLCSHGAHMLEYRSPEYDYARAFTADTRNLNGALKALTEGGGKGIVFTGTVFEPGEGAGSDNLRAVSPYGATKRAVYEMYRAFAEMHGLTLAKFVIPNPFGAYEDPKLPSYLMKSWNQGSVPEIKTPSYIRDNIHVGLLARCYSRFCGEAASSGRPAIKLNPSQYIESQGRFVLRFAEEMSKRLNLKCPVSLNDQQDFPEPRIRVNTDPAEEYAGPWDDKAAWDDLATYYEAHSGAC